MLSPNHKQKHATNKQTLVDAPNTKKSDLRRARSGLVNLAPTSTGSATAIALIFPDLKGKLNGLAVRVPLTNASITDCVFEVKRPTSAEEVNALLKVFIFCFCCCRVVVLCACACACACA